MGKNVYAAPRKGPAGKWVEQSGKKPQMKNTQEDRQAHLKALAEKYKKITRKNS